MQYCHARKYPVKKTSSQVLDGVSCTREAISCTGVKICEYLHPTLLSMTHSEVTEAMWQEIRSIRNEGFDEDTIRYQANRYIIHYKCISNTLF